MLHDARRGCTITKDARGARAVTYDGPLERVVRLLHRVQGHTYRTYASL